MRVSNILIQCCLCLNLMSLLACSEELKSSNRALHSASSSDSAPMLDLISSSATAVQGNLKTLIAGLYVSAEDQGTRRVMADRSVALDWELLKIVDINGGALKHGDSVYIQTYNGYFLQVTNGTSESLNAASQNTDTWEMFYIVSLDQLDIKDGSVIGFKSASSGKWLTAWNGGGSDVRVYGAEFNTWERFVFSSKSATTTAQTPVVTGPTGSLYVNQSTELMNAITQADQSNPESARLLRYIADQPTGTWLGGWIADVEGDSRNLISRAGSSYATIVLYNIPLRDCGQHSSGGAASVFEYKAWIDKVVRGIGSGKAIVIVEPDAVTLQNCLSSVQLTERTQALSYAIEQLKKNVNSKVYLDAGNSDWLATDEAVLRLNRSGIAKADGFSLNVANFRTTDATAAYGQKIRSLLGNNKNFVIDTSRNGNGPLNSEWCNPAGRALGRKPTLSTGIVGVDALLWIKRPGESDGTCNGGPAAGSFWINYALELARNAKI